MSVSELTIRVAGPSDLPALTAALRALAVDLGDPFRASDDSLKAALSGANRFAVAVMAEDGGQAVGVLLAAPIFSTRAGGAVLYVSDLWVAPTARRRSLGRKLLAAAAREGSARWQSGALKLTVHADNARAQAFYTRLGFAVSEADRNAFLDRAGVAALEGGAE